MHPPIDAFIEGKLEVKLPTIWTDEKQRREESEKKAKAKVREEKRRERKIKEEKVRKKKVQACRHAKRYETHKTLRFSNNLWLQTVEK